jgi:glycosyltransferase involved in cell wall biosynthesis
MHCHQYTPFVYGSLAKLLRPGTRLVFTEHGRLTDAPISWKRRLVNPFLGRIPERSFAVCQELRGFLLAEGFPGSRLEVAYNGVDPGPPAGEGARKEARRQLGIGEDRFAVGTVGRLDPVKDLSTLIEGFTILEREAPGAVLLVVGEGPERTHLEELVRARDLCDSVVFSGHRTDVRDLLPALDLYVNSSLTEGVSLTIIEAMAASLPVVATRVGGNPEVVLDGLTGVLVPARDAGALARAIRSLAENEERRRAWGAAARRVVEERFSFNRMLDLYIAAYLDHR